MTQALLTLAAGLGGVALGAWLSRRNQTKAAAEQLLVDALNDVVRGIADIANGVPDAQAGYASAMSRVALHGSQRVVSALRRFQDEATTVTPEGRRRLIAAVREARRELGHDDVPEDDLAVLLFGPARVPRTEMHDRASGTH